MARTAPPQSAPPPDLPSMPDVGPNLTNYLRRFSAWATTQLQAKVPLNTGVNGVLLTAFDAPAGTLPNTYLVQVQQTGTLVATLITPGSSP
jgi:hypothetical protein